MDVEDRQYWKDAYDKYDLIEETDSTIKITEPGYGQDLVHPMSGLGQVLRQGGMDLMNMFKGKGDEMDPGIYANPPKEDFLERFMEGSRRMGELFQGSQYPQYEFDLPDGTGYSFDPNNPMNLYPDNPDSPYYDPGPMDFDEDDPYWDSFA